MRKHLVVLASVAIVVLGSGRGDAQVDVIKRGSNGKIAINLTGLRVSGGPAGGVFQRTLESDLQQSGWFLPSSGSETIAVQGECADSGGSLKLRCHLIDNSHPANTFKRSYRRSSAEARQLAHQVADEIVMAVKNVPGIASTRIAMIGSVQGKKDLYFCDADGGRMTQVTRQGAICLSPAWAPDAESLVYTSFHGGYPDIYRIDLTSGRRSRLAGYPGLNAGADISPDGRSMVMTLSKDGNPELYIMDLASRRLSRLTTTRQAAEASPSWSPDGKQIVFVSDSSGSPQLYVASRSGGQHRRITFRGSENVAPDWGRDGRIAYSSRQEGRYHICVMDPSDGQPQRLTSEYVDHEDPAWARDGRHIVYVKTAEYRSSLYILDTMGDPEIRLTATRGDWYSPAWSVR